MRHLDLSPAELHAALFARGETVWLAERGDEADGRPGCAYVVATSGTASGTGSLVRVPRAALDDNLRAIGRALGISAADAIPVLSPPSFDPFLVEALLPCLFGARHILVPPKLRQAPALLYDAVVTRGRATRLFATPSLFLRFAPAHRRAILAGNTSVTTLVLGGEPFPAHIVPGARIALYNIYGTTECSVWSFLGRVDSHSIHPRYGAPLGSALGSTQWEVDPAGFDHGSGLGELIMGGPVRATLVGDETEPVIMRRTGDIVFVDGENMYYVGRKDHMFKRFGSRLDLASVRAAVSELMRGVPGYSDCCVVPDSDELICFVFVSDELDPKRIQDLHESLLRTLLPHSIPSSYCIAAEIPITKNGKVDTKQLLLDQPLYKKITPTPPLISSVLAESPAILGENFFKLGGTSIDATALVARLCQKFGKPLSDAFRQECLTMLVNYNLRKVIDFAKTFEGTKSPSKRPADSQDTSLAKRARNLDTHSAVTIINRGDYLGSTQAFKSASLRWKVDLKKCIDASPVVVKYSPGKEGRVFVGSHAGLFVCVDLRSGEKLWEIELGDRIEATACLSQDGEAVFVGCYDGKLYCVSAESGTIKWSFQTSDAVKSTAAVYSAKVWFGSHDRYTYCVSADTGTLCWKHETGKVFGSLQIHNGIVYVCSLSGVVYAIDAQTQRIAWTHGCDGSPIFSSPRVICQRHLLVASVDGKIRRIDLASGALSGVFDSKEPIFSSIVQGATQQEFLVCSQRRMYHFNTDDMEHPRVVLEKPDNPLYSAPLQISPDTAICVGINGGGYLIARETITHFTVPGETFSSIVGADDWFVVGSRDDNLYIFTLVSNF